MDKMFRATRDRWSERQNKERETRERKFRVSKIKVFKLEQNDFNTITATSSGLVAVI